MSKKKETEPAIRDSRTTAVLEKISKQLERLIVCQEKRLSGEVIKNFNSEEHIKNKGG